MRSATQPLRGLLALSGELWLPNHGHGWWQGQGSLSWAQRQSPAAPPPQTRLHFAFRAIHAIQEAWLELHRLPGAWWARLEA